MSITKCYELRAHGNTIVLYQTDNKVGKIRMIHVLK